MQFFDFCFLGFFGSNVHKGKEKARINESFFSYADNEESLRISRVENNKIKDILWED